MLYAKVEGTAVIKYPATQTDVRRENPNVSFPAADISARQMLEYGYVPVTYTQQPTPSSTEKVSEGVPEFVEGVWRQTWLVKPKSADELQADAQALQAEIVTATQQRLDDFASTRNYDGILSACTYATSAVPKFAAEGQYAVQARDATWAALYAFMADVQAGTQPVPSGFEDVGPLLPPLAWPI